MSERGYGRLMSKFGVQAESTGPTEKKLLMVESCNRGLSSSVLDGKQGYVTLAVWLYKIRGSIRYLQIFMGIVLFNSCIMLVCDISDTIHILLNALL